MHRLAPEECPDPIPPAADPADQVKRVTVTLLGQVKASKSSLVNALLGEQRALTDVQIAAAIEATCEQLGEYLTGIVPVCTAKGKE